LTSGSTAPRTGFTSAPLLWWRIAGAFAIGTFALATWLFLAPEAVKVSPFIFAPLAAGAAVVGARSVSPREARSTWNAILIACVSASLAQVLAVLDTAPVFPSAADLLAILFHVAMAEAAILALRPARDPRLAIEIALDGLLVLLSAAILVVRLQLDEALLAGWLPSTDAATLLVSRIAVVGSLLFSALLVLWRDSELGGPSIDMLFVAALLFSFGDALGGTALDAPPGPVRWIFDLVRLTAWSVLAGCAVAAWHSPGPTIATSRRSSVASFMRLMIIPAAVLFLAAWALVGQGPQSTTNLGRASVAALALVLAVRVGVAIFAVEREAGERQAAEGRASRARIRALTAQMNPHFLFNTLHSLAALLRRDPVAAESVLQRLGGLLRYGIDRGDTLLPLSEEWQFTQSYIDLERVRLGARLSVDMQLDPEAADRLVPPFILQPLVENAIRHAVDATPSGGGVSVRAELRADVLAIEVTDSGTGASPEALWAGKGVGLRGVRAQLAAHYGDDAKMEAESGRAGFTIRLVLPALDD
jgi:signal transduction histidine kinase